MRQALAAFLVCPLLFAGRATAQQKDDTARILGELNDKVRAYQVEARTRHVDLRGRVEVLDKLLEGIETISMRGVTLHVAAAQRKVEEARARASQPAFLGRPVPAVLDEISALFDRPPFGVTPERLRDLAVQTLVRLEENVVELEEAAWNDTVYASSLRDSLLRVESSLRSSWLPAIRVSVEARRAALGLRLTLRAPPYPKPAVRAPRFPVDLRECVRAYEEDALDRLYDLARRVEVLYLLTEGGDAIPYRGDSLPKTTAREKLEQARARAAGAKPLEAPVPGVLYRIGSLLDSLSSGLKSPQGRGTYFWTVTPLEENVLELAEGLRAEAVTVGGIAAAIQQIDDGSLRGQAIEALRVSIQARRAALGLRPVQGERAGGEKS